ncbi:MAG TPA: hypothetical protein VE173_10845 [Longimicrobiales bacterium]|nr:hypothetical protein [Longimicrobiales bacterium]
MAGTGATLQSEAPLSPVEGSTSRSFVGALNRLPARIVVAWSMGGGVVAGGLLIAAMTLSERLSSSGAPELSAVFFLLGAGAGVAHGGLLAYLSRDPSLSRTEMLGVLLRALPWAVPGLLLSWAAALWMSLTAAVLQTTEPGLLAVGGIVVAWLFGLTVCGWAAWEGVQGVVVALRRWPDLRVASVVISVVFAVLATTFVTTHPQIWWTDVRVTGAGALILALGATVWIALPVVIAGLGVVHRLARRSSSG